MSKHIDKRCVKCGYNDTHIRFLRKGSGTLSYDKERVLKPYIENYKFTENIIFCVCRTCGYEWVTKPLDEK